MDCFKNHNVEVLGWPARSPELNPIENMWGMLVQNMYRNKKQFEIIKDLKNAIVDSCEPIDLIECQNLIRLISRVFEVILCKEKMTKYSLIIMYSF